MGKYNLDLHDDSIDEITLNKFGDKIFVSGDDANLWERFGDGYKKFIELAEKSENKLAELEKKYPANDGEPDSDHTLEELKIRTELCESTLHIIDDIFGEGTAKKSFREQYEAIPEFLPDEDKLTAFFDVMTPIMEDIFKRKAERSREASKKRMGKYQPQDHKRKGTK